MHLYVTFSLLVVFLLQIDSVAANNRALPHKINTQLYTKECEIIIYVKDSKYIDVAEGNIFYNISHANIFSYQSKTGYNTALYNNEEMFL